MKTDLLEERPSAAALTPFSTRLHHTAYVCSDQEQTRHFYEDVLGIPLTGFWIERETLGDVVHEFSLALYSLSDGCALSFFNFADAELQERNAAKKQGLFVHLALQADRAQQDALRDRLEKAGYQAMEFHHGYARSLYVEDPDGQTLEFCEEPAGMDSVTAQQRTVAHQALQRWQAGDRTVNNVLDRKD
jgi:catechol 2,3-dioxygenase-like lactoylglutathione lyase family enzyme